MKYIILCALFITSLIPNPIKSSVYLSSYFTDGDKKSGMGILIDRHGNILTNSKAVYNRSFKLEASLIKIYIQDIPNQPIICFAQAKIKALDTSKSLALLQIDRNSNIFCNPISSFSSYHANYYDNYAFDIFGLKGNSKKSLLPNIGERLFYPFVDDDFEIDLISSTASTYLEINDQKRDRRSLSIALFESSKIENIGGGVFNEAGDFIGILDMEELKNSSPSVIPKSIIAQWFCELANMGVLDIFILNSEKKRLNQTQFCKNIE